MKSAALIRLVFITGLAVVMSVAPATASEPPIVALDSVGTAFSYQGRLLDDGVAANGIYDFGFSLHDAVTGGAMVATCWRENVAVTDGLFSVMLDFGPVFNGTAYWLAAAVRAGDSAAAPTPLLPRTPLAPAPYALSAHTMKTDFVSTLFIPAAEAVLHAASDGGRLDYYGNGGVHLVSTAAGTKDIVFPVTIPGTLYSEPVGVEMIYLGYESGAATGYITRVIVYRTKYDGTYREIVNITNGAGWNSTSWSEILISLPADDRTLAAGDGLLAVRVFCTAPVGVEIAFTGLELRLLHQASLP